MHATPHVAQCAMCENVMLTDFMRCPVEVSERHGGRRYIHDKQYVAYHCVQNASITGSKAGPGEGAVAYYETVAPMAENPPHEGGDPWHISLFLAQALEAPSRRMS